MCQMSIQCWFIVNGPLDVQVLMVHTNAYCNILGYTNTSIELHNVND